MRKQKSILRQSAALLLALLLLLPGLSSAEGAVTEKDGVEWYVVECERHFDSLEAIGPSFVFLSNAMLGR